MFSLEIDYSYVCFSIYEFSLAKLMIRSSEEVVHSSRFNLAVFSPSDRRGSEARTCIVATRGKMTVFKHIIWSYFVYIMSSCSKHYSVCHELNTSRCMLDSGRGLE
jgi:hypothetical protein